MNIPRPCHNWSVSYKKAVAIQKKLSLLVRSIQPANPLYLVAGVDAAYSADSTYCIAGVVLWNREKKVIVEQHRCRQKVTFPYVPGLLSFREAPAIIAVLRKLSTSPDVILCDGQGIAHPRRLGIASHIGVLTQMATIGCAKSRLVGSYNEPSITKGSRSPLMDGNEQIGTVLRTRDKVRPVFISVGHLIDQQSAEEIVLDCAWKFRLPEPIRLADQLVSAAKRSYGLAGQPG